MTARTSAVPVRLNSLTLHRAFGIPNGFRLADFGPGVTVIWGPNGSGKSTTARALHSLFCFDRSEDGMRVEADVSYGDEHWTLLRTGKQGSARRGGIDQPNPGFARLTESTRDRYLLALHDLLRVDDSNFADLVAREMSGGYDIEAAATASGFEKSPSLNPRRLDVQKAIQAHSKLLAEQNELTDQRDRMNELLAESEQVLEATRRRTWLLKIQELHQLRVDANDAGALVDSFDGVLASAKPTDAEMIAEWMRREPGLLDRRTVVEAALLNAQEAWNELGAPDIEQLERALAELETRIAALKASEGDLAQARQDHGTAAQRAQELTVAISAELPIPLQRQDVVAILGTFHAALESQDSAQALAKAEAILSSQVQRPEFVPDQRELWSRVELLTDWLQTPTTDRSTTRRLRLALLLAAAVVAAQAVILGARWHEYGYAFALVSVVLIVLAWRIGQTDSGTETRHRIAGAWERAQGAGPDRWERDAVIHALDNAIADVQDARKAARDEQLWTSLAPHLDQRADQIALAEQRVAAISAELGPGFEVDRAALHHLATSLGTALGAAQTARQLELKKDRAGEAYAADLRILQENVTPLASDVVADAAAADGLLVQLRNRLRRAIDVEKEIDRLVSERDDVIDPALERIERDRNELIARFDHRSVSEIEHLLTELDSYLAARSRRQNREDNFAIALNHQGIDFALDEWPPERLEQEIAACEAIIQRAPDTNQKIGMIRQRVSDAERSNAVAEAINRITDAKAAYADAVAERLRDAIGAIVLDEVRIITRRAHVPAVVQRARALFRDFTSGRYELRSAVGKNPGFSAFDTTLGEEQSLNQLSSGTRVQLLIAVRLAFVEHLETDAMLPVIFDETLANADDIRSDALIDTTLHIASTGRQVVYFTAQLDEVEKWQERAEQQGTTVQVVDLSEARGEARQSRSSLVAIEPLRPREIPAPADLDRARYRDLLAVPFLDVWADDSGPVHLWHFFEDLHELHRLMSEHHVTVWGQVRQYEVDGAAPSLEIDRSTYARLNAIGNAMSTMLRSARIGHGRPVTIEALIESGGTTPTFDKKCRDLLQLVEFDGAKFIARLEANAIKGFQTKNVEKFRTYFEENGHLGSGDVLDATDIRARTAAESDLAISSGLLDLATIDRLISESFPVPTDRMALARTSGVTVPRLPSLE